MPAQICPIIDAICGTVYCEQGRQVREQHNNPIINELLVFARSLVMVDRVTRELFMCLIALYVNHRDCTMVSVYDISFSEAVLDIVFLSNITMTITRTECIKNASAFLALLRTC